jgi:hypothetical protein
MVDIASAKDNDPMLPDHRTNFLTILMVWWTQSCNAKTQQQTITYVSR